jgi:hypothetical protein
MQKNVFLIGATTAWLAVVGLWALDTVTPAQADWYGNAPYAAPQGYGGPPPGGFGGHGFHGGRHHGGMNALCGGGSAYMIDRVDGFVRRHLDLDPNQKAAWDGVVDSADDARRKLRDACADRDDWSGTTPERLARMETLMAAGLDAVREVRPRFDAFYATLSDDQKATLDDAGPRHRHHRHHKGGDRNGDRD